MDASEAGTVFGLKARSIRMLAALSLLAMLAPVLFSVLGVESLPGFSGTVAGDFDIFHAVGQLALEGRVTEAYDLARVQEAQAAIGARVHEMTWTYPPPFDLAIAPLGLVGRDVAYVIYTFLGLALYLGTLWKLAGRYYGLALAAALPAALISLRTGQNGCLTAGLTGLACLGILARRESGGGVALGLLVIKPHLGLGLGLWSLFRGRWRLLAAAVMIAALACGAATIVFGWSIWGAFLSATGEAGRLLREGRYPTFRMASVFAALTSLGLGTGTAIVAQGAAALFGIAGIALAARQFGPRPGLAAALVLTPLFSPYFYDYDLVLYGPAFALILPEIDRKGTRGLALPAVALAWIAGGTGLVQNTRGAAEGLVAPVSAAGLAALALGLLTLAVLVIRPTPPERAA